MANLDSPDGYLAELFNLHTAKTADALHQILVLQQPFKSTADSFEPMMILRRHHETEPEATAETALLLVTDRRWGKAAGQLVREMVESGMLDGDTLDWMAELFLTAGDHLYFEIPEEWFGGEEIVLDLPFEEVDGEPETEDRSDGPLVATGRVYPPPRRWAVERVVAHDPQVWRDLFDGAGDLGRADGSAVMRGLLDGIDHLPTDVHREPIDADLSD